MLLQYSRSSIPLRCKGKIMINSVVSLCSCFSSSTSSSPIPNEHFLVSGVMFRLNVSGTLGRGCSKQYQNTKYITCVPVGISWNRPQFVIMTKSVDFSRSLSTQTCPSKDQINDELFIEISSAIKSDPESRTRICTSYIDKLLNDKKVSTACKLLQTLHENHIFFSLDAYNLVLATAGEMGDIDLVVQTFKDMIVSGEILSSKSYRILAQAFIKTDDSQLLIKFVIEILELSYPQSLVVVNQVIYAFSQCRQSDNALLVFDHMKNLKCKPDQITYNIVLETLGRTGRLDEMIQEFALMKEANIGPDIISYNTMINSLRKVGRLDLSLVYLQEMVENGFEPDLRTYTALIESFGRLGNIEQSLRLFGEMKQRHIQPSIYIYRSLISSLKRMGKWELAITISKEMDLCSSDIVAPKDFKKKERGR